MVTMRCLKIILLCLMVQSFAAACKPRREKTSSDVEQIFAADLIEGGWRVSGVNFSETPYLIALENGCSGFVIDWKNQYAMTAAHCHPVEKMPIYWGAVSSNNFKQQVFDRRIVPAQISEIIESSRPAELDYAIFKFTSDYDFSPLVGTEAVVSSAANNLSIMLQRGKTLPNAPDSWVYMTGYPSDKYAQSQITTSKCHVQSTPTLTKLQSTFKPQWTKLMNAWEAPDSVYKKDPRYPGMRECFRDMAIANNERFFYDCSVYGGNSGGPIYYRGPKTARSVVIGLPRTYYPDPEDEDSNNSKFDKCIDDYGDTFFKPIVSDTKKDYPYLYYKTSYTWNKEWDSSVRNPDPNADVTVYPSAIPMVNIVKTSSFFKEHLEYWSENATGLVKTEITVDRILDPKAYAQAEQQKKDVEAAALEAKRLSAAKAAQEAADLAQAEAQRKADEKKRIIEQRMAREANEAEAERNRKALAEASRPKITRLPAQTTKPQVLKPSPEESAVRARETLPELVDTKADSVPVVNLAPKMEENVYFQKDVRNLNIRCDDTNKQLEYFSYYISPKGFYYTQVAFEKDLKLTEPKRVDGESHSYIAKRLGLSRGNVKTLSAPDVVAIYVLTQRVPSNYCSCPNCNNR